MCFEEREGEEEKKGEGERGRERKKERNEKSPVHWFIPQMLVTEQ